MICVHSDLVVEAETPERPDLVVEMALGFLLSMRGVVGWQSELLMVKVNGVVFLPRTGASR